MRLPRQGDIVCRQAVELVTDYLEGALTKRARRRFETHLKGCANCRAYLDQMRSIIEVSGSVKADDLTPDALSELVELYRRWSASQ
jgi:predicted anti-sigma-YlaC factor YlaD